MVETKDFGLTSKQTAARIGCSDSWLRKSRITGDGPKFYKVGSRVLYRLEDIEFWIESRLRNSTSEPEAA